ncbi:uncharacterized protein N0V89_005845 [Didymosphaeria variabile]|uniref:Uncharacterized protein n=1 Tax=Didymosphaeria variabile TaxID=1932322 RepID=A0A9W9CBK9_9PLEO|nr:uncharacterized protein N0V89_005845 [Didymosphaeria variabile]KAJ4354112.1 hypothetical protein N0V89_005845 [Didymosphaeria variabile]
MSESPNSRDDLNNNSELSISTSFAWGNQNLPAERSTGRQHTIGSIQPEIIPGSPDATLQEANSELSRTSSQDIHPSPVPNARALAENLPYYERKSYRDILQRPPQSATSNSAGNQGSRLFKGLDDHATMLLKGFSTYDQAYSAEGSKKLPEVHLGNKSNSRVDFGRVGNTTGDGGHSSGHTGTGGRSRSGSTGNTHLHLNQDRETTTHEQMDAIMHQATENLLMYSLSTQPLADALHQNVRHAQGLWLTSDTPPYDILDMYIFFETKIVQDWNASRLDKRVPYEHSMNVLDEDSSFPLRWAAIKNGVKIRKQRSAFKGSELQTSEQDGDKQSVRATMLVVEAKPLPERSSRPLCPQSRPVIPEVSFDLDPANFATGWEERVPRPKTNANPYDLLQLAPSANVPFPETGKQANVTAVELMVFFPRYLKSTDVIDRLISNGGSSTIFAHIVNEHRVLKGTSLTKGNYFYTVMKARMRRRGPAYSQWTVADHPTPPGHNSSNLNIAGLHTEEDVRGNSTNKGIPTADENPGSIQFKCLGQHVKKFPSGFDALDLTRCIEHAIAHPTESWGYPEDFARLVGRIGGPSQIQPGHHDRVTFQRWKDSIRSKNRSTSSEA